MKSPRLFRVYGVEAGGDAHTVDVAASSVRFLEGGGLVFYRDPGPDEPDRVVRGYGSGQWMRVEDITDDSMRQDAGS